ncbi:MAG: hypothetical protein RLZZ306_384 [Bacteroidota bacterium]|jgi:hypothetical protein
MKTATKNTQLGHTFTKATYNPALDYLDGKVLFKKKLERAEATLKKYGLPKELMDKYQK